MRPRLCTLLLCLLAIGLAGAVSSPASGLFSRSGADAANTFSADTLDPPTSLSAAPGSGSPKIKLAWTPTVDAYATGYNVLRSTTSGGPYTQVKQVTPATATGTSDTAVVTGTTYYYVVRSYFQNWESANSNQASAVAP